MVEEMDEIQDGGIKCRVNFLAFQDSDFDVFGI